MRILLTGVSSFTGAWFAAALAGAGHKVLATLQRDVSAYDGLPADRIAMARAAGVELSEQTSYGSDRFLDLVGRGFDVVCFHGADVRDHRSPDFDILRALDGNLRGMRETCRRARQAGTARLVVTGTVAEPREGTGDDPERAMSPYGLSKALTWEVIKLHAEEAGLALGKFVIPNPFGPLEQERYCTYLVRAWLAGEVPVVRTPDYIRDNIPVDKCARAYADFVAMTPQAAGAARCAPSGYVGTQADFTSRFAREIGSRLDLPTPFALSRQTEFSEPRIRINTDVAVPDWDEAAFWDSLAHDYAHRFGAPAPRG